jgi:hypothetical protein
LLAESVGMLALNLRFVKQFEQFVYFVKVGYGASFGSTRSYMPEFVP